MQEGSVEKFTGKVEADETFVGGKARNMHANKKGNVKAGTVGKVAVMGLLERTSPEKHSRVKLRVVRNVRRSQLQKEVKEKVAEGSEVFTDALRSL